MRPGAGVELAGHRVVADPVGDLVVLLGEVRVVRLGGHPLRQFLTRGRGQVIVTFVGDVDEFRAHGLHGAQLVLAAWWSTTAVNV